jgi:alpha-tubulin suppressor-like RCC1 family protein
MRPGHALALALALAAAALGCGDTLVDHDAPIELIGPQGNGCTTTAACGPSCTPCTGAPATAIPACLGPTGAERCDYECQGGFIKCTDGASGACCQAIAVASGGAHSCAITDAPARGALYCWGANESGQVNGASGGPVLVPQKIKTGGVTAVALGAAHTCAIVSGAVECWGANGAGQAPPVASVASPTALAAGASHTCAIGGGSVTCWGGGAAAGVAPFPASAVASGANHSCAMSGGEVRCWGAGALGQLGNGLGADSTTPVVAPLLGSGTLQAVAAGSELSCAARSSPGGQLDPALQCWGSGLGGLLSANPQLTPAIPLKDPQTAVIRFTPQRLSVGRAHVCVSRPGDPIECLGSDNAWGQLGGPSFVPPDATPVSGSLDSRVFSAGADHTCAVFSTGGVFCWGRNSSGQLGDGTQVTPFVDDGGVRQIGTPVAVSGR